MKSDIEWTDKNLVHSMVGVMDFGLSIHDREYNIVYQNHILKNKYGGLGGKCYRVYEGRKNNCEGCPVGKAFIDGKTHSSERIVNMPSGEVAYWEKTANPIKNLQGEILTCLEISRDVTERKKIESEIVAAHDESKEKLIANSMKLQEANIALKVLLEQREIDKKDHENRILTNIKMMILPYIERLKLKNSSPECLHYISTLESNVMSIVSSLSTQLSSDIYSLTPKEVEVCNLIKDGKQSKEIAEIMQVSYETVNCHRQNIRKKLGLNHSKVNLKAFISSLSE